jgi:uncharacterized protein (TIGR00369 family)
MIVPDADFEQRTRDSFARQPAMATLGVAIESIEAGRVVLALAHRVELTQQHGFLHAGMIATALDSACGYAAFTLMPVGAGVLTIEYKINLLAPARGPWIWLDGHVTKAGRSISVADGRAYEGPAPGSVNADVPEPRKLIATLTATLMTVIGRGDVRH